MTSEGGVSHFGAVDETTKRLVGRCVRVKWLRAEEGGSEAERNGAVARKFLGVEQAGAMASALSVVEVAAQRERPGVQTLSRKEAGGAAAEGIGVERSPFEVEGEA